MFWFKLCPRCNGDLFEDRDQYGSYITCMQCGFSKDVPGYDKAPLLVSAEPVSVPMTPESDGSKRRRISRGGRHFSKTFEFICDQEAKSAA